MLNLANAQGEIMKLLGVTNIHVEWHTPLLYTKCTDPIVVDITTGTMCQEKSQRHDVVIDCTESVQLA
jgi:hypothetical protein